MDAPNLAALEELARSRLSRMALDYYQSGADEEWTLAKNVDAFRDIEIHPRVMVGVADRDLTTTALGQPLALPIMTAPTAFHRLADPDGEIATARGTGRAGSIYVLSTLSNTAVEEVMAAATGPVWFQLYLYRDRQATADLVQRIEAAGAQALVLTCDSPLLGRRNADVHNRFQLPDGLRVENMFSSSEELARLPSGVADSGLAAYFMDVIDPGLCWKDIDWLRSITRLPLVLKGITRSDDAELAVKAGADAIVVSNHGGRQLDSAPATIQVLEPIVQAVAGAVEVYLDSGVRRGTDVVKALGLGARAVWLGRPILWGLAAGGADGVAAVYAIFRRELDLALALAGCPRAREVPRDRIVTSWPGLDRTRQLRT